MITKVEIFEFLAGNYSVNLTEIAEDTPLFSSGLLDSFAMVELVSFLETNAHIKFKFTDITLDNLDSVSNILSCLERVIARA